MKIKLIELEEIIIELDNMREYNTFLEKFIPEKDKQFEAWLKKESRKLKREEKDEFVEYYEDLYWERHNRFPNILRGAFLVSLMSLLEYKLVKVCRELFRENKYSLKFDDFERNEGIIRRTQSYLKKVAKINFPDHSKQWKNILIFQFIRNAIVHNDTRIRKENIDKIFTLEMLSRDINLNYDEYPGYIIMLGGKFCLQAISDVENFFKDLYGNLGQAIRDDIENFVSKQKSKQKNKTKMLSISFKKWYISMKYKKFLSQLAKR